MNKKLDRMLQPSMGLYFVLLVGFCAAAITGFLAISLVKLIIKHDKFKIFGIYTLVLGILCVGYGIFEYATNTHFSLVFTS